MRNMYFEENKHKTLEFNDSDLTQVNFFKTKLKDVDLTSNTITGLIVGHEDIRGAIINEFQAIDLIMLLGVKIK